MPHLVRGLSLLIFLSSAAAVLYVSMNAERPVAKARSRSSLKSEPTPGGATAGGRPEARASGTQPPPEVASEEPSLAETAPQGKPAKGVRAGPRSNVGDRHGQVMGWDNLGGSRWRVDGQCQDSRWGTNRADFFAKFDAVTDEIELGGGRTFGVDLRIAPGVPREAEEETILALFEATRRASAEFGEPTVFLYANVEQMRRYACVTGTAVSYYDGAVHVAWLGRRSEHQKSVAHEYAHHLLTELGIDRPVWLHEGFAQDFAGEHPEQGAERSPYGSERMTEFLPVDSSPEETASFYYQSFLMWKFLRQLTQRRGLDLATLLANRLLEDGEPAVDLFLGAARDYGAGVFDGDVEDLWRHYYKTRRFSEGVILRMFGMGAVP